MYNIEKIISLLRKINFKPSKFVFVWISEVLFYKLLQVLIDSLLAVQLFGRSLFTVGCLVYREDMCRYVEVHVLHVLLEPQ